MTRSMIDAHAARVRLLEQLDEVRDRAELRQDRGVVGDVVAAVAQRGWVERRQPQAVDAEPLQVVEPVDQAAQVADAVAVGVGERAHQHLVEDGALVPLRVAARRGRPCGLTRPTGGTAQNVGRLGSAGSSRT